MDTVFYMKNYKTEMSTNSKINEHLLIEIRFTILQARMTFAFDLKMAHEDSTIYIKISRRERRCDKIILNDVIIDKNYVPVKKNLPGPSKANTRQSSAVFLEPSLI